MSDPGTLDRIVNAAAKDEEFARVAREAMKFEDLAKHEAWISLEKHVQRVVEATARRLAEAILKGHEVDQREIDRLRGYLEGMRAVVALPSVIDSTFEKQVERAWRRAQALAADTPDQEDEPHGISP